MQTAIMKTYTVRIDNEEYSWNGEYWYETRTRLTPPSRMLHQLNTRLMDLIGQDDNEVTNPKELSERARRARDAGQFERAEQLARRLVKVNPTDLNACWLLGTIVRATRRPEEALKLTERGHTSTHLPLLILRASAYADLEQWDAAQALVTRVLARDKSEAALRIAQRIHDAQLD